MLFLKPPAQIQGKGGHVCQFDLFFHKKLRPYEGAMGFYVDRAGGEAQREGSCGGTTRSEMLPLLCGNGRLFLPRAAQAAELTVPA